MRFRESYLMSEDDSFTFRVDFSFGEKYLEVVAFRGGVREVLELLGFV